MSEVESKPAAQRASWSIPEWCFSAGFSVPRFYTIPNDLRPRSVPVGRRRLIIEPPAVYLERVAAMGGLPSRPKKAA